MPEMRCTSLWQVYLHSLHLNPFFFLSSCCRFVFKKNFFTAEDTGKSRSNHTASPHLFLCCLLLLRETFFFFCDSAVPTCLLVCLLFCFLPFLSISPVSPLPHNLAAAVCQSWRSPPFAARTTSATRQTLSATPSSNPSMRHPGLRLRAIVPRRRLRLAPVLGRPPAPDPRSGT